MTAQTTLHAHFACNRCHLVSERCQRLRHIVDCIGQRRDFTFGVHPLESVRAETVHVAVGRGNAAIAEQDRELVGRLGAEREEVPRVVGFLNVGLGIALLRMDEVGKLERVANEEHGGIVAHQVVVAFLGVELDREAARIA